MNQVDAVMLDAMQVELRGMTTVHDIILMLADQLSPGHAEAIRHLVHSANDHLEHLEGYVEREFGKLPEAVSCQAMSGEADGTGKGRS